MDYDYDMDLQIDPTALDVEWLEQPRLFMKYAEAAAQAKKEVDQLKEALDVVKAQADHSIREEPEAYGLTKVTEATVLAAITQDGDVRQSLADLINGRYELEILNGAVRAFEQRKTALENMVRLHGASYFAGPTVPRDVEAEIVKHAEKKASDIKVKKRMQRKKDK